MFWLLLKNYRSVISLITSFRSFDSYTYLHSEVKWSRSVVSDSVTPWTAASQAPPSMGFSRQEYWSGLPSPSPSIWTTCQYILKSGDFTSPSLFHLSQWPFWLLSACALRVLGWLYQNLHWPFVHIFWSLLDYFLLFKNCQNDCIFCISACCFKKDF